MLKQSLPYVALAIVLATGVYLASITLRKDVPLTPGAKYYTVKFGEDVTLRTEVAETKEELQNGLMNREKLPKNTGMLFIFGMDYKYAFWMKNTLIPLDIIWINEKMEVVDIAREVPPCVTEKCPSYIPQYPARYVVETPAKWSVWKKIYPSMKVKIYREDGAQL
ncbi:hypothetical protein A2380_02530 [candidate division WWE3 bacterium RIFOXYB1_FULL_43_24]|uniref:DUF192 domain-containing protein n=2 Tax=Katanobacteria TaxID=422282 RepID=A0A0G0YJY1_UNCKA|nr:MAG: hypothetical protein UU92_C0008G0030 [candidate division WWE3 bacterium GW2011_GWA1_42_12]KKS33922.1 MAG: hypothetical protein UU97_C0018G0019 [candidate division WWE3 bacterium GW2011_GWD1_42_14]KKS36929.1 MAG: hypothetical protein UV00_C0019G0030 [candidate division WWE3 bacterium GW2011_GWF1_42_14]KKS39992.1 MAG: hypothetical protein UV03_C0015G0019 [candidate division WWE3 bacterium GW2011_GWE1_42_16]KKS65969.1 MAG: hypothetical protein UV35_C0028G0018 [candidate division WWE3 bacte